MSGKAVAIACGGKGTRLGYDGQKCLVPIAGRPFLAWKLDQLLGHGATEIHLLVSHLAEEVGDFIEYGWSNAIPVYFHYDEGGIGPDVAHRRAARHMPFVHWFTYGDCLLDVPLHEGSMPYMWVNEEHPDDAGLGMRWGQSWKWHRKWTDQPSYHLNTPEDYARMEAYLADLH